MITRELNPPNPKNILSMYSISELFSNNAEAMLYVVTKSNFDIKVVRKRFTVNVILGYEIKF